jgi:HEAT repeat protein
MELENYAQAVEDNYQHLADILLDSTSSSSAVEHLLSIEWAPVPPMKRGYAIWSEGIWSEALACFPTDAFPCLLEVLQTAPDDRDLSLVYKALTMWGDRFAAALSDWLHTSDDRLRGRAIHGLTLYGELLNTLCDADTPSVDKQLHRENYPELTRMRREWEIGIAPPAMLAGTPRLMLSQQLTHLLTGASNDAQQIAILRCLRRLGSSPLASIADATEPIVAAAAAAASRTLEREAVVALCYLARDRATAYMRQHWCQDEQQRHMAAELLGLARTETAFEMLRELLGDPNAETRRKAIASIESFETTAALDVLNALQESDRKTHRQLLRSRNQLKRRLQKRRNPVKARSGRSAIYAISPLVLLSQAPAQPVFSERALTASVAPELIADISSSRRYAVELGLLERRTDLYRLSSMGAAVHWVESYVQDGLSRFACLPEHLARP